MSFDFSNVEAIKHRTRLIELSDPSGPICTCADFYPLDVAAKLLGGAGILVTPIKNAPFSVSLSRRHPIINFKSDVIVRTLFIWAYDDDKLDRLVKIANDIIARTK